MPLTLDARPDEHFDLVRIQVYSGVTTRDLLTTQSDENPV